MKANATSLLGLFENKSRLEVPLFQRQYVWKEESQWEPLWEDIERKFTDYLDGRKEAPVHFLGAMVLDQKMTPTTHVVKRQVIDGQQRLTTFQLFLAAFRDFCRAHGCEELSRECEAFTFNRGMMANPEVEKFKVWPTQKDRVQFVDVLTAGSREALEVKYPRRRQKRSHKNEPRPLMVEAYLFFYSSLTDFLIGKDPDLPMMADQPLAVRADECLQALKNALQVVVIDLEQGDDAQVIFETLNARGEPLLPADLLRNYIFLRAARAGESQEDLYEEHWHEFDTEFWRKEIVQGRLNRPRSDLFLQHFLAARVLRDIAAKHLFVEYKYWIEKEQPFVTVRDELAALARQRDQFRRLLDPQPADVLYPLATFLRQFDTSTAYPLLLHLAEAGLSETQWQAVSKILESYIVRRAVCDWSNKNHNRIFLNAIRLFQGEPFSVEALYDYFNGLNGESAEWPNDDVFRRSWYSSQVYRTAVRPRLVPILLRLNETYLTTRSESVQIKEDGLTVEHILPQGWREHWLLPDGSPGVPEDDLDLDSTDPELVRATLERDRLLHTIGNLTIITGSLNSAVSNAPWPIKKPKLLEASLLPINQKILQPIEVWDERSIQSRASNLFERALTLWPRTVS